MCAGILFQQSRAHRQKRERDAQLLAKMRRLPLMVTEHADCRMDCRCGCATIVSTTSMTGTMQECAVPPLRLPSVLVRLRHISRQEVDAVLTSGSINSRKSEPGLRPCPK